MEKSLASCDRVLCRYAQGYSDRQLLCNFVRQAFAQFGLTSETLRGKRVVLKPNLVMKAEPDRAATVHPSLVDAVLCVLDESACADVVLAESCGGPFHAAALAGVYRVTGMEDALRGHRARLNDDFTADTLSFPQGKATKQFRIIHAVAQADIVINLSKLKSHALTTMSGAVKNFFGTIPGLEKFEMHARFPEYDDFSQMLVDLCLLHHTRAQVLNLLDAVVCMEGNGPTAGKPHAVGCLFASDNAFALDMVAAELLGFSGRVLMLEKAKERGLCTPQICLLGDDPVARAPQHFLAPDTKSDHNPLIRLPKLFGKDVFAVFRPRPVIEKTCVGCGRCVSACPAHTITLRQVRRRDGTFARRAKIHSNRCIRCFCCQELCPHRCVRIHKNLLLRFLG